MLSSNLKNINIMISRNTQWLLVGIYCAVVFIVDINLPLGVAAGILYAPILFLSTNQNKRVLVILVTVSIFLEIIGYFFSPSENIPAWIPIVNRAMSIILLFVAYYALKNRIVLSELKSILTVCAWTKQVKVDGEWLSLEDFLQKYLQIKITHGIAPDAAKKMAEEAENFLIK